MSETNQSTAEVMPRVLQAYDPHRAGLKDEVLTIVRKHRVISEGKLLELLFPPPVYPVNGSEAFKEAWREWRRQWTDHAYGSDTIAYRDGYAAASSKACIELTRAGLIKEHNNGFAAYSYSAVNP